MSSEKIYFFLAGLPRSGITLLGSILNQNPDIYVGPTSPVLEFMVRFDKMFHQSYLYNGFIKENFRQKLVTGVCHEWYSDIDSPIIIDKNRGWPSLLEAARMIAENVKIICPVRSIPDILSSFIILNRKSSENENYPKDEANWTTIDKQLKSSGKRWTDNNRCHALMAGTSASQEGWVPWTGGKGTIGDPLNGMAKLFVEQQQTFQNIVHLVEYEDLISDTKNIMYKIYEFLQIPNYEHVYDNIIEGPREDDTIYGMPTLHEIRSTISKSENNPLEILSTKIIKKYSGLEFWRRTDIPSFRQDYDESDLPE
jgi:hypothetical protein